MKIQCQHCQAQYLFDEAVLKGAKGALVRCRSCGNSILVLVPGETNSGISVFHSVTPSQNHVKKDEGTGPAVSSAKEKQPPSSADGQLVPVEEWELKPERNGEGKGTWLGITEKLPPVSVPDQKPSIFLPPFPKSPSRVRHRRRFRWPSIFSF